MHHVWCPGPFLLFLTYFSLHHYLVSSCPGMVMSPGWSNWLHWKDDPGNSSIQMFFNLTLESVKLKVLSIRLTYNDDEWQEYLCKTSFSCRYISGENQCNPRPRLIFSQILSQQTQHLGTRGVLNFLSFLSLLALTSVCVLLTLALFAHCLGSHRPQLLYM